MRGVGTAVSINAPPPPRHAPPALSAIAHPLLLALASGLGLGVTFVSRDCLEASGLDDAIARASVGGQGGGLHFNLASTSSPHVHWGVETSPVGSSAVQFPRGLSYHCNAYLHDTLVEQGAEGRTGPFLDSSTYRQSRVEARSDEHSPTVDMTPSSAKAFVLGTIGDNADSSYPIYRSGAPPDYGYVPVRLTHARGTFAIFTHKCTTGQVYAPFGGSGHGDEGAQCLQGADALAG